MVQLEEWQVKHIEDTLRLVANQFNSSKRETCLDRMIMQSWNWVVDALNNVPIDITSENGIMYSMRVGQKPKLNKAQKNENVNINIREASMILGICNYILNDMIINGIQKLHDKYTKEEISNLKQRLENIIKL